MNVRFWFVDVKTIRCSKAVINECLELAQTLDAVRWRLCCIGVEASSHCTCDAASEEGQHPISAAV